MMLACVLMFAGCGQSGAKTNSTVAQSGDSQSTEVVVESLEQTGKQDGTAVPDAGQAAGGAQGADTDGGAGADNTGSSSNMLVVYFSRTGEQYGVGVIEKGNTAIVADMIVEQTGADSFEILPQEDYYPYTYKELTDVAKQELNDNVRPAYAGTVPDLSQYDTIFIGAPVWWGDWPMIMYTFFENNEEALAGKTLIPFSTHAGSGLSGFDSKLSRACPNSTVSAGLAIAGTDAQNDQDKVRQNVDDWLSGLGY